LSLNRNYQIQSNDCETQLSVTGIVVKSTSQAVRIISSLTKEVNQSTYAYSQDYLIWSFSNAFDTEW